jgi:hypothetical protein
MGMRANDMGWGAMAAGSLMLTGPVVLSDATFLAYAQSTAFVGGAVQLNHGVTVRLPDETAPTIDGSLPGTITATTDAEQLIGTVSRAAGANVSATPLGWGGIIDVWDSGAVVNSNGRSFTLFLMASSGGRGVFSPNGVGGQHYAEMCAAAGLVPIAAGRSANWDAPRNCQSSGCMGLSPGVGPNPADWVQANCPGLFATTGLVARMAYNANPAKAGDAPWHAVCAREHPLEDGH